MRRFTSVFVSVALCAALGAVFVDQAAASVGEKSVRKFCKAALNIGEDISDASSPDALSDAQKAFKKLSKLAPTKKIKKATKLLSKYYGILAGAGNPSDLQNLSADYGSAVGTYSLYVSSHCSATTPSVPS